jgi:hypothetical protein
MISCICIESCNDPEIIWIKPSSVIIIVFCFTLVRSYIHPSCHHITSCPSTPFSSILALGTRRHILTTRARLTTSHTNSAPGPTTATPASTQDIHIRRRARDRTVDIRQRESGDWNSRRGSAGWRAVLVVLLDYHAIGGDPRESYVFVCYALGREAGVSEGREMGR